MAHSLTLLEPERTPDLVLHGGISWTCPRRVASCRKRGGALRLLGPSGAGRAHSAATLHHRLAGAVSGCVRLASGASGIRPQDLSGRAAHGPRPPTPRLAADELQARQTAALRSTPRVPLRGRESRASPLASLVSGRAIGDGFTRIRASPPTWKGRAAGCRIAVHRQR